MKIGPFLAEIWPKTREILSQGTPHETEGRLYRERHLYWRIYGRHDHFYKTGELLGMRVYHS